MEWFGGLKKVKNRMEWNGQNDWSKRVGKVKKIIKKNEMDKMEGQTGVKRPLLGATRQSK